MVAKSFQTLPIIGEPYTLNGRQYVTVATKSGERRVRWYSEDEYYRMYPDETPAKKTTKSLKEVLGFAKGYISLFKGDVDEDRDEFIHSDSIRYNRLFGWYCPSECDLPENVPDHLTIIFLSWDDIAVDDDTLLGEQTVRRVIEGVLFQPSESEHQGAIGDKISVKATVKKVTPIDGMYGRTYFHVFHDEKGNAYTWNTKTQSLTQGRIVQLSGTISAHDTYRNEKQTKLVRCKINDVQLLGDQTR